MWCQVNHRSGHKDDLRLIWRGNWGSNSGAKIDFQRAFDMVKASSSRNEYEAFVRKYTIYIRIYATAWFVFNDFLKVAVYRVLPRTKWLLGREHTHELVD